MKIKGLFFDFDGVIMDSMHLKLDAYCEALKRYQFKRTDIDKLMRRYMGQSRKRILSFLVRDLSGIEWSKEEHREALDIFNRCDEASRSKMTFMPGSLDFLKKHTSFFYTAVVTGTPQYAIDKTIHHFQLTSYFDCVKGSPETKVNILSKLLTTTGYAAQECLFIGDGRTDQVAADAHNMPFVGMDNRASSFEPTTAWKVIANLNELEPDILPSRS